MKISFCFVIAICLFFNASAQFLVTPNSYNYGAVPLANQLYASFIIKNNGNKNGYLLKVNADNTVAYKKPVKAIVPGGFDTLRIWYNPDNDGAFDKTINVYFSDNTKPITLSLKGNLLKLDKDPTVNCYSFSQKESGVNIILCDIKIVVEDSTNDKPIGNAFIIQYFNSKPGFTMKTKPDGTASLSVKPDLYHYMIWAEGYNSIKVDPYINRQTVQLIYKLSPLAKEKSVANNVITENKPIPPVKPNDKQELSTTEYASNNIVFLIDVSASMRRKDKLPLLKESMHTLIDQLRSIDKVSIITYADNAKVIYPSKPVTDKESLTQLIDSLIANGSTSANRGIELAHKVVMDNYITSGNNQIILATDGAFTLREKELELFDKGNAGNNEKVLVTVLGFGTDKKSLHDLKKISSRFSGHYIYIPDAEAARDALLEEIKHNSRMKK